MKLHAHFLAESANFASDGTFTVFKGGITDVGSPMWPVMTKVAIVTRLELDSDESRRLVEMRVRVTHEGQGMGQARTPLAAKAAQPGQPSYVNSILTMNLIIPGPGRLTIAASINEEALPLLYIEAVQLPRQAPGVIPAE